MATSLGIPLSEFGSEALQGLEDIRINSMCTVFAESEVISLKAKGATRADIAAGIHIATARRVRNLFNRLGLEDELVFTGGVSNNAGMKKVLEEILGHKISEVKLNTIYAGALGAAVIAQKSFASAAQEEERQEAVNG